MNKPNCFECEHKRSVPGNCHIGCANRKARVEGSPHGIKNGWFYWPLLFDPTWLVSCDGFTESKGGDEG